MHFHLRVMYLGFIFVRCFVLYTTTHQMSMVLWKTDLDEIQAMVLIFGFGPSVGACPRPPLRLRAFFPAPTRKKTPPTPTQATQGSAAGHTGAQGCRSYFCYFCFLLLLRFYSVFILFRAMATNGICFCYFFCIGSASVFMLFILFALIRRAFFHRFHRCAAKNHR